MAPKQKSVTLYNIIFPLWAYLYFSPLVVIPLFGNLLVDGGIIMLVLKRNGIKLERKKLRKQILQAWGLGFVADLIGVGIIVLNDFVIGPVLNRYVNIELMISYGPHDLISLLVLFFIVMFIGYLIFLFNRGLARKAGISDTIAYRIGLMMGILTAPWLFIYPMFWNWY